MHLWASLQPSESHLLKGKLVGKAVLAELKPSLLPFYLSEQAQGCLRLAHFWWGEGSGYNGSEQELSLSTSQAQGSTPEVTLLGWAPEGAI